MNTTITLEVRGEAFYFEWDNKKNIANEKRHHVSFQTAMLVFADIYRIERYDDAHSVDEDRFITIGMVDELLYVVYTERKDRMRLITARIATAREAKLYYDNKSNSF